MGAYLIRRLLLVIPTLWAIITINFFIVQIAPGGPVDQAIAAIEFGQGGALPGASGEGVRASHAQTGVGNISDSHYRGGRGLDPEVIAEITHRYGFDKPLHERYFKMLRDYLSFDFGDSLFRSASVLTLIKDSLPVSITLGYKPLLVRYEGQWYFPLVKNYSERDFGGPLATTADYQDPWLQRQLENRGWVLWAPVRFGANTINFATTQPFPSPPSAKNWLGTDANGGDVFARILYGTRISILFGLMLTICSSVMGVLAGALQGYYGGKVDLWGQRLIEVWSGMPTLFLIILLSSVVQPNFWWLLAITVLFGWMSLVGVVRAEFLRTRNFDYIRAAQALGVSDRDIILRHMLPNAMVATLTFLPFILCSSITTLTSLDFLGFGLPLGSPSLGELLLQGKNNLQAPWLGIAAFLSVAILLSLLIFIGEAVRDAFDPAKAV